MESALSTASTVLIISTVRTHPVDPVKVIECQFVSCCFLFVDFRHFKHHYRVTIKANPRMLPTSSSHNAKTFQHGLTKNKVQNTGLLDVKRGTKMRLPGVFTGKYVKGTVTSTQWLLTL